MAVLLVSILPFGDVVHCCDLDPVGNHAQTMKHSHSGWVPLFYVASSTLLRARKIDVHGDCCMLQIWKLPKLALIHQWATNHSTDALASVVRQAALLHISGVPPLREHLFGEPIPAR
jgi:hypothetical protein